MPIRLVVGLHPVPTGAAALFPAKGRRIFGCAPPAHASDRLPPIPVLSCGTKCFDNPCVSPRSASLPNDPVRPSLLTKPLHAAVVLAKFGNSLPAPSRHDACHLCADNSAVGTRVGRHGKRRRSETAQHKQTHLHGPVRAIVLTKFLIHSKLRKVGKERRRIQEARATRMLRQEIFFQLISGEKARQQPNPCQ